MSDSDTGPVLVIGATGAQGGATARCLLAAGRPVRVLTRDPTAPAATALAAAGAELVRGDLDDQASLAAAVQGMQGVFSVQVPDTQGTDSERRQGFALVAAARAAGVRQFVHTSVDRAGLHTQFPGWGPEHPMHRYWLDKWEVEEAVVHAGFDAWTVLRPAFMLDNLIAPKVRHMFPHLRGGEVLTTFRPRTRLQFVAAADVGAYAAAAFAAPTRFHGLHLGLGADAPTMEELAAALSRVSGRPVRAVFATPAEAVARGLWPAWVQAMGWIDAVGYSADTAAAEALGPRLTRLDPWLQAHRDQILVEGQT